MTPLRVIGGSARGVSLRLPGEQGTRATRPTTSRLREALFSMLEAADTDFACVLDLYAGSGALGIEALSRGGEHCTFVDRDLDACATVRENLARAKLAERAVVVAASVGSWRPPAAARYTLVLADPPYDDAAAWDAIARTVEGALQVVAMLAIEHSGRVAAPDVLVGAPRWRERRHGDGAIAIYRREAPGTGEDA